MCWLRRGTVFLCAIFLSLTMPAGLRAQTAGAWISTGSLTVPRLQHTATLLPNGKVLVAGGVDQGALASAELYDPATGTWTPTGSLSTARFVHAAMLLPSGKVLVAAGLGYCNCHVLLASAEVYDPAMGTWTPTGSLSS